MVAAEYPRWDVLHALRTVAPKSNASVGWHGRRRVRWSDRVLLLRVQSTPVDGISKGLVGDKFGSSSSS